MRLLLCLNCFRVSEFDACHEGFVILGGFHSLLLLKCHNLFPQTHPESLSLSRGFVKGWRCGGSPNILLGIRKLELQHDCRVDTRRLGQPEA
jgi:hypothetical protein